MKPVSDYLRDIAELLEQVRGKASNIEQARTICADVWPALVALVETDRAHARAEPLEVLRDVVAAFRLFSRDCPTQICWTPVHRAEALLSGAPERTEPTALEVAERVREACAAEFDDASPSWAGGLLRGIDLAPILEKLGAEPGAAGGSTGDRA